MRFEVKLSKPTRRRAIGTGVLCATASTLFLAPAGLLPGAELSPQLVLAGVAGPLAVAVLWWNVLVPAAMIEDVDKRTRWRPQAEREPAGSEARR